MAQTTRRRQRYPKGTWMKLRSKDILVAYMEDKGFSCQRLAIYAQCSKSFIGFLRNGDKTSCSPELALRIAEALDVPLVGLFVVQESAASGKNDKKRKVAA